jgi:outer membrane protein OmpA-like peptidoglycan-associated protein
VSNKRTPGAFFRASPEKAQLSSNSVIAKMKMIRFVLLPLLVSIGGCSLLEAPLKSSQIITRDGYQSSNLTARPVSPVFEPYSLQELAQKKHRMLNYSHAIVLMDNSEAMRESIPGYSFTRAELAQETAHRLQMTVDNTGVMPAAISTEMRFLGERSVVDALTSAAADIGMASDTTILIFSRADRIDRSTVATTEKIIADNPALCVHVVSVGDESARHKLHSRGSCNLMERAEDISTPNTMAAFALKVFYGDSVDSDGDGITDDLDRCLATPSGVRINWDGCPFDEAALASLLYDRASSTSIGRAISTINFNTNESDINPEQRDLLVQILASLNRFPNRSIRIEGHADSDFASNHNRQLSAARAEAVRRALIEYGIAPERLSTQAMGVKHPISDNRSAVGRAENRRVEIYWEGMQ